MLGCDIKKVFDAMSDKLFTPFTDLMKHNEAFGKLKELKDYAKVEAEVAQDIYKRTFHYLKEQNKKLPDIFTDKELLKHFKVFYQHGFTAARAKAEHIRQN